MFVLVLKLLLLAKGLFERSVERSAFWTFLSKMSTGDDGPPKGLLKLKLGLRLTLGLAMLMLPEVEQFECMPMPPVRDLLSGEVQAFLDAGAGAEDEDEDEDTTDSLFMLEGSFLPCWFLCWRWRSLGKGLFNAEKLVLPAALLAAGLAVLADGGGEGTLAVSDLSGSYSGSFLDNAEDEVDMAGPVADGMSVEDLWEPFEKYLFKLVERVIVLVHSNGLVGGCVGGCGGRCERSWGRYVLAGEIRGQTAIYMRLAGQDAIWTAIQELAGGECIEV